MDNVICVSDTIWRQIRADVEATKRIVEHGIDQAKLSATRSDTSQVVIVSDNNGEQRPFKRFRQLVKSQ